MRFAFPAAVLVFLLASSVRADDASPRSTPVLSSAPWIGVAMDAGGDAGVKVEHVVRGSPADRGGVRAGDRIVAVASARITAPDQVTRAVGARKIGETLAVSIERRGTPITVRLVLAARPSSDEMLRMDFVGLPAPAWANTTAIAGAPRSIDQLRGRVVLVDFWAAWCGPCRLLAPHLNSLKDRFGAQGLTVVGITTDDAERAAVFSEKHQMRYPIVVDKDGDTSRAYGVTALPTMLLVDKKGVIRDVFVGYDPTSDRIEVAVKKLLAEAAPPSASESAHGETK